MYSYQQLEAKCFGTALRYLTLKPRTEKEVRDKVAGLLSRYVEKGFADADMAKEVPDAVIRQLRAEKFVNDSDYAFLYVTQSKKRSNPLSKMEMTAYLNRKGVSRELIEHSLSEYSEADELDNIGRIAKKRIKSPLELSDRAKKAKHINYFLRRGFTNHLVQKTLNSFI